MLRAVRDYAIIAATFVAVYFIVFHACMAAKPGCEDVQVPAGAQCVETR